MRVEAELRRAYDSFTDTQVLSKTASFIANLFECANYGAYGISVTIVSTVFWGGGGWWENWSLLTVIWVSEPRRCKIHRIWEWAGAVDVDYTAALTGATRREVDSRWTS